MKLLLALDLSPFSEVIISEVARRPWPAGTKACALNVFDLLCLPGGSACSGAVVEDQIRAGKAVVGAAAARLAAIGVETAAEVTSGYAATAIIEYARNWQADLILVGSLGQAGLARFLLGNVAKTVLREAPCAVEIVRPSGHETGLTASSGMKIFLATDGSEYSILAACSVAARPWPQGSEVRVISVIDAAELNKLNGRAQPQLQETMTIEAQEATEIAEKILAGGSLKTTRAILTGHPKAVIVEEASRWGADLIVVGSHGQRGLRRFLMGSVSEAVALHAHCSVEVIRGRVELPQS